MTPELKKITSALLTAGGKPYLVGGAVRDRLLGRDSKDLDIEVFGLSNESLAETLKPFGKVQADVGKAFSVIKLYTKSDHYDFSLPRRERKIAPGHKGFEVTADPSMSPEEAASRRDYTINAMMLNLEKDTVEDFFGGEMDLHCGVLRHISSAFSEDPLRVLRGFQLCSRFDLKVDPGTAELCNSLLGEYKTFPVERIWNEWYKWALKSTKPSNGLQFLVDVGWDAVYPEIKALLSVPQDPEWHPEGDVFTHTKCTVDAAAEIADRENIQGYDRVMYLLTALMHDFGKPATTEFKDGRWRSHMHAKVGAELAPTFLDRIGVPKKIGAKIPPLVADHLCHTHIKDNKNVRKLSHRLQPANIEELCWLIEADCSGRPPKPKRIPPEAVAIREMAIKDGVLLGPPKPIVTGKMLLTTGWVKPGKAMGKALEDAYAEQLKCRINNEKDAADWIRNRFYRPIITGKLLLSKGLVEPGPLMGKLIRDAHIAQEAGAFDNEDDGIQWVVDWLSEL